MTALHYAEVQVDADGDLTWPDVLFVCTGGPTDVCHQWCAEGCEEQCYGNPIRLWPEGDELIAQAPAAGHRWEPMPPHGDSCRIVDWLVAVGWQDTGWTDDDEEITASQLRPGRHRIEEEWTGYDYIWRYADATTDLRAAVPEDSTTDTDNQEN